ncbi:L-fucose:H+ symporter permease [Chitinophaga sp. OAE865]|uniref:L-fucose:H+ symporter permease n=1 Tax=Chitinophaga sp. OAE865 TaxID=2817898 RepID=UPI001AE5FC6D
MNKALSANKTTLAIGLITALFFLWGFALNLNPILIPHLKKACRLSDVQSAFIDSASYIAYFLLALPAGRFMYKYGYKGGILLGLLLFAAGAVLFYPAAATRSYLFFLCALFIIASGLTFLETAANSYITVLGDPAKGAYRLNLAQSFNGLAAFMAPLIGGRYILSGKALTASQEAGMSAGQLDDYLKAEASSVQLPFLIIALVVLSVAVLVWRTYLPEIKEEETGNANGSVLNEKNLLLGVGAQFFYVGAQVCISSFFIRFSQRVAGIEEVQAAYLLSAALLMFMVGRFAGTLLMRFMAPPRLLVIYSILVMLLLAVAISTTGITAVYALMAVEFFMSIMFPTIFALSVKDLGAKTKKGSSLVIMAIVGGAILPVVMGRVSDASNIQQAYIVPAICFIAVLYFGIKNIAVTKVELSASH